MDHEYFIENHTEVTNVKLEHLAVEIVSEISAFDAISGEWNELTDAAECHIFQTYTWLRTWWKYFGGDDIRHQLHILLFRDRNRLVGIAPFFIDRYLFKGKTLYRCLRLMGSRVMQQTNGETMGDRTYTDYLDVITLSEYDPAIWPLLENQIKNSTEYDDIVLDEIPEYSSLITGFIPYLKQKNPGWEIYRKESSVCAIVKFPESWNLFLNSFNSKMRYNIRLYLKRASDENGPRIFNCRRVADDKKFDELFDWLVDHHQQRWNSRGRPGVFAEKRIYEFYKEAAYLLLKQGIALFQVVSLPDENDRIIVTDLAFRYKKNLYGIQRSFDASTAYAKYSPGHTALFTLFKDAIDDGVEKFNFLRGNEAYKFHSANEVMHNNYIEIRKGSDPNRFLRLIYNFIMPFSWVKQRFLLERDIFMIHCKSNGIINGTAGYGKDFTKRLMNREY